MVCSAPKKANIPPGAVLAQENSTGGGAVVVPPAAASWSQAKVLQTFKMTLCAGAVWLWGKRVRSREAGTGLLKIILCNLALKETKAQLGLGRGLYRL